MADEEIDLRELINVLLKRKYIIIGITLMAILIAGIINYAVLSPVYKSSATFKIAKIDSSLLFNKNEIENKIKSDYVLQKVADKLKFGLVPVELSNIIKIDSLDDDYITLSTEHTSQKGYTRNKVYLYGSGYVTVSAEYGSPEKARDIVLSVINQFIEISKPHYQDQIALLEKEKESTEKQMEIERENMDAVEKLRFDILKSDDLSLTEKQIQINLLLNYSIQIRDSYNELAEKYYILENQILNSSNFELIKYPSIPQAPIKPNKKLNLAISGVLGLFLGVFIAFFTEFWQSGKQ